MQINGQLNQFKRKKNYARKFKGKKYFFTNKLSRIKTKHKIKMLNTKLYPECSK